LLLIFNAPKSFLIRARIRTGAESVLPCTSSSCSSPGSSDVNPTSTRKQLVFRIDAMAYMMSAEQTACESLYALLSSRRAGRAHSFMRLIISSISTSPFILVYLISPTTASRYVGSRFLARMRFCMPVPQYAIPPRPLSRAHVRVSPSPILRWILPFLSQMSRH
jgi:hypothetical protein